VVLSIDVSGSMRSQDLTPTRLEAAKEAALPGRARVPPDGWPPGGTYYRASSAHGIRDVYRRLARPTDRASRSEVWRDADPALNDAAPSHGLHSWSG